MVDISRVKRNAKKLLDGGASSEEVQSYLQMEGVTNEQVRATPLQPPKNIATQAMDFVGNTITNALDMASVGWNDEAAAALGAIPALMPGGESYSEAYSRLHQDQEKLLNKAVNDDSIGGKAAKLVGDTAGLVPAMLLSGGTAQVPSVAARLAPQGLLPRTASAIKQSLTPAATTGGRVRQGTALGATAGGVRAAGDSDKKGSGLALDTVRGTAVGGLTGGLVSAGSEALAAGASKATQILMRKPSYSPKQNAARRIAARGQQDGLTPQGMVQSVRDARKIGADEFTLLDTGGANVKGLGRTVYNMPGEGSDTISHFTAGRQSNQAPRYTRAIETHLGPIESKNIAVAQAKQQAKDVAGPYYQQAHRNSVPASNELLGALERPSAKQGIKNAGGLYAEAGRKAPALYDEDGRLINLDKMSVEQLHYIRESIDHQIGELTSKIEGFKGSTREAYMLQTRKIIDDALKQSPLMKQGDNIYSRQMGKASAIEDGYQYMTAKPKEVGARLAVATPAEREGYAIGARARMGDEVGSKRSTIEGAPRAGVDLSKTIMGTPYQREILPHIAPNGRSADDFSNFLRAERQMADSFDKVNTGTTTARQQELQRNEGLPWAERLGQAVRSGGVTTPIRNTIAKAIEGMGGMDEIERQYVAEMLTNTTEEGLEEFLNVALQRALQQLARQQTIGPVSTMGGFLAGQEPVRNAVGLPF